MIIFRADGNSDIGSGHIMRCLSIAEAGKILGEHCLFVTADEGVYPTIHEHGHENSIFHTDYRNLSSELEQMRELINTVYPSVLFVDSYYVTEFYLNTLWEYCREIGCILVYIDDVCSFAYPCDILINYNIYGPDRKEYYKELYRASGYPEPRFLLGTGYAPLRAEFQGLSERVVKRKAENILISTGGSDPEHISKSIAELIVGPKERFDQFYFHFIIGGLNDDRAEIEKIVNSDTHIFLHTNVKNMSSLMQQADVAVSAAGSTLYELCATQTPTVTYVLADNQALGAEGFCTRNIMHSIGDVRRIGVPELSEKLITSAVDLAQDFDERTRISKIQRSIIDGNGAKRLIMEVMS